MTTQTALPNHIWSVAESKARLSEVLRLADEEGPQRIGLKRAYVVVPERLWQELGQSKPAKKPLGRWLVDNFPRGVDLEIPSRASTRAIPFSDEIG